MLDPNQSTRLTAEQLSVDPWLDSSHHAVNRTFFDPTVVIDERFIGGNSSKTSSMSTLEVIDSISSTVEGWWGSMMGGDRSVASDALSHTSMQETDVDVQATIATIETRVDALNEKSMHLREELRLSQAEAMEEHYLQLKQQLDAVEEELDEERKNMAEAQRRCIPMPKMPVPKMPRVSQRLSRTAKNVC